MIVRPAEPHDADGIAALIVPIQREEFGLPITLAQQPDLRDIDGFYRTGAGQFWVAADGAEIVGSIALIDVGGNIGVVRKMFVHPDFRGKGHGVASRLFETLRAYATAHKFSDLYLGTTDAFLAAHRFYEKHGFDMISDSQLPQAFPRMEIDTRFYRLLLNSYD
jgi:N-acetylglutamate synthase-like GNAT family acetyltransferase